MLGTVQDGYGVALFCGAVHFVWFMVYLFPFSLHLHQSNCFPRGIFRHGAAAGLRLANRDGFTSRRAADLFNLQKADIVGADTDDSFVGLVAYEVFAGVYHSGRQIYFPP